MPTYVEGVLQPPQRTVEPRLLQTSITFDGTAGLGAIGAVPIFTVTGEVLVVSLSPICTTGLAGATATLSLGVTAGVTDFIAATLATDIDAGEFWQADPSEPNSDALEAALENILVTDNIVGAVLVAAISAGVMRFDVIWRPLSSDGNLV